MSNHQPIGAAVHFWPWAGDRERGLRERIRNAQTIALRRASSCEHRIVRELYYSAAELAAAWMFRRVNDVDILERVLCALCQMFMACSHIVIVEAPDAP